MNLNDLGWGLYRKSLNSELDNILEENVARVAVENRGGYLLYSQAGELEGIMRGKFMRGKKADSEYPKVGDWVVFEKLPAEEKAVITSILPRKSKISRKKIGKKLNEQIIAANVDVVFVVQGLDNDFNLNKLARYVAMTKEGDCEPIILLNKCDVVPDAQDKLRQAQESLPGIKIFLTSATNGTGIENAQAQISAGISLVFVGSSGVGKSTLINTLLGIERQKIGEARLVDSKGRHTTTRRELILLPSGGVLIDTPGMRELGMWAEESAAAEAFEDVEALIGECKFNDCDHQVCQGCAVVAAVDRGEIAQDRYDRFIKLKQEIDLRQKKVW